MTYDDIAAIFLAPLAEPIAEPDVEPTPARRLRDALEPIATQGWWSRPAGEGLTALGVDFFPGYVWGRAAALGTPTASVVAATFGVFEPGMISAAYEAGVASATRDDILDGTGSRRRSESRCDRRRRRVRRHRRSVAAGGGHARRARPPLFSALRSLPVPSSPGGRLWRAAELVREHRGDGHLAALVGAGLDAVEANVLTERWLGFALGEYSATRGFGADALADAVSRLQARGWMEGDDLTESGRAARAAIEAATDAGQQALVDACGDDLDGIVTMATDISARLIGARAFPADPRKRAGG